tara:strand:+ start:590 stop:829 length:240 start_codon:yes stop_codon:yes gene_type:complete
MKHDINKISADELLERRVCCGLGCYNCPYDPPHKKGNKRVRPVEKRVRLGAFSKGAQSSHWDMDYLTTDELEKLFNKNK